MIYSLQELCVSQNIQLLKDIKQQDNNNLQITCPIHKNGKESNPSCNILLTNKKYNGTIISKGQVHCFTCGYKATFEEFLLLFFTNYSEVKQFMKSYLISNNRTKIELNFDKGINNIIYCNEDISQYEYTHPYMYKRGLTDPIINAFNIGYDIKTKSITFPVYDENNNLIMVQRRHVNQKKFDNGYASKKGSVLYGNNIIKQYNKQFNEIWITESPLDALSCWANKKPAVALMGCKPTKYQLELLNRLPTRKLILALDNDEAGKKGIADIANNIKYKIIYIINYPNNLNDVNEIHLQTKFNEIKSALYYFIK